MLKKVYIETTIPSFYYETRTEPEMVARRTWTREWWNNHRHHYELVTSASVFEELEQGRHPNKAPALELIAKLPLLTIDDQISDIVETYMEHHVMPKDPSGDPMHLALASFHNCHFLLTWNCAHLANANKFEHIRHVNSMMGLFVPTLITPAELIYPEGE